MKHFKYAPLTVMLAVVPQVHADDQLIGKAFIPQAYVNVPFSGVSREQETPTYGLSLKQYPSFNSKNQPMLNLEFRGDELNAINVNGLNVLDKRVYFDANGVEHTEAGIDWETVVWGVVGITAAAHLACVYGHERSMKWAGFGDDCKEHNKVAAVS